MGTNKHAIIRYKTLDKCFRNPGRRYFIDDLIDECSKAVNEYAGISSGVSKRQVQEDIKFMESLDGYSVDLLKIREGRKIYYRYKDTRFTIDSEPLNEYEANQLKEALSTLERFQGLPQFEWISEITARLDSSFKLGKSKSAIIEFDQNPFLKGLEHIAPLYYAISESKTLLIDYKGATSENVESFDFSPHYLKQYNSRWFLLGVVKNRNDITNLALDRIIEIKDNNSKYQLPSLKYEEYFEDIVGVTVNDENPETIKFEVTDRLLPYVMTKPLHGSQKLKTVDNKNILELFVIPNYELESLILSHGEGLKLLEPLKLKEKIIGRLKKIIN